MAGKRRAMHLAQDLYPLAQVRWELPMASIVGISACSRVLNRAEECSSHQAADDGSDISALADFATVTAMPNK